MSLRPETVEVGPYRIDVVQDEPTINMQSVQEKVTLWGHWDPIANQISLRPGMHRDTEAEVLLHETLHAIFEVTHLNTMEDDEDVVSRLTPVLLDTLRRNPKLVVYLMGWDE